MELVIGFVGALICLGIFVAGFFLGKAQPKAWVPPKEDLTPEEAEKVRQEREALIEEQKAYQKLINYNADQAYGISKPE